MRSLMWMCILMWTGCSVQVDTWEDFLEEYAHTKCLVYKECYRAHYEGEYENYSQCKEEVKKAHQTEQEEEYADCSFSSEEALECMEEMNTSTCGTHWDSQATIFQACHEDIWKCSAE